MDDFESAFASLAVTPQRERLVEAPATCIADFRTPIGTDDTASGNDWPTDIDDALLKIPLAGAGLSTSPDALPKVLVVFDPRVLFHVSPTYHVEEAARVRAIFCRLISCGVLGVTQECAIRVIPARFATRAELERVHSYEHIDTLLALDDRSTGNGGSPDVQPLPWLSPSRSSGIPLQHQAGLRFSLDAQASLALFTDAKALPALAKRMFAGRPPQGDNYYSFYTPAVAILAAGGVLRAVDMVASGESVSAFAIIRPPGHHCSSSMYAGFCWLSNVAIGVRHAQARWGVGRIAILDFDVHHGDGTSAIFADDPSVLLVSIHRHENGAFYPYGDGGAASRVGRGRAAGMNVNIAWPCPGLGDDEYAAAMERIAVPVIAEFRPEMIFVSAGFDAADGDPLGGMRVSSAGYRYIAALVAALDPPLGVVFALEGGYSHTALAGGVEGCIRAMRAAAPLSRRRLLRSDRVTSVEADGADLPGRRVSQLEAVLLRPPRTPLPRHMHSGAAATFAAVIKAHRRYWRCIASLGDEWMNEFAGPLAALASARSTAVRSTMNGGGTAVEDDDDTSWLSALPAHHVSQKRWSQVEVSLLLVTAPMNSSDGAADVPYDAGAGVAAAVLAAVAAFRDNGGSVATRGRALRPLGPAAPRATIAVLPTSPKRRFDVSAESKRHPASLSVVGGPQLEAESIAAGTPCASAKDPCLSGSSAERDEKLRRSLDDDATVSVTSVWKPMTASRGDRHSGLQPDGVVILQAPREPCESQVDTTFTVYDGYGRAIVEVALGMKMADDITTPQTPSLMFVGTMKPHGETGLCELFTDKTDASSVVLLLPQRRPFVAQISAPIAGCTAPLSDWSLRSYEYASPSQTPSTPEGSVMMVARDNMDSTMVMGVRLRFDKRDDARLALLEVTRAVEGHLHPAEI